MKIYALLVGINKYPWSPLEKCVGDVGRIETYLHELNLPDGDLEIVSLLDAQATKENIANQIKTHFSKATDEDVALFYYSGHGAYEESEGRFTDEHDGLLECMVCHYTKDDKSGYLLADKELRYLFSQLEYNPHLVTVFDCCHSGDIIRDDEESYKAPRRLPGARPPREYKEFIFHNEYPESDVKSSTTEKLIPFKNHVHLAACTSEQLAWEAEAGGIFTTYLLKLLKATQNNLTYRDITRWAKISLKETTDTLQTPTISVQGEGNVHDLSKWLLLTSADTPRSKASISFNKKQGWYLNMGTIMGIQPGTKVFIKEGEDHKPLQVSKVELESSLLADPVLSGIELDIEKVYEATVGTVYSPLNLYINDLDDEPDEKEKIQALIEEYPNVALSKPEKANIYLNIFNQLVYFSLQDDPYRPIAEQIDVLALIENEQESRLVGELRDQLQYIIQWNHFNTLENPEPGFEGTPLKVEINLEGSDRWKDITNGDFSFTPKEEKVNIGGVPKYLNKYQIRVTNITDEDLHVGVLTMGSNMAITDPAWNKQVIFLRAGDTKLFFDHKEKTYRGMSMEPFQEIYNWPYEWLTYKFIFNNYEDFTPSLPEFLQPGLKDPLTIETLMRRARRGLDIVTARGDVDEDQIDEKVRNWGTLVSTLRLINPTYNQVSGELAEKWNDYSQSDLLGPFIQQLYFDMVPNGFTFRLEPKPSANPEKRAQTRSLQMFIGPANFVANIIRKRKFKKAVKKLPKGSPGKPIIVAEGDSWFLHPMTHDILNHIMRKYPVRSLAAAGDTLQNYKKEKQLIKVVQELKPEIVMLSGGGNDIIGPDIAKILKPDVPSGQPPIEYLNQNFTSRMETLEKLYIYFMEEMEKQPSVKKFLVHGYDYIRADHKEKFINNGWVNKYLRSKKIEDEEDRQNIINFLIKSFNEMLERLSNDSRFSKVVYIDLRGKVQERKDWYDEIHPNSNANEALSKLFLAHIS